MFDEKELQKYLVSELANLGYEIACGAKNGSVFSYLYAKKHDSLPVLLVAHTDTVHDSKREDLWYDDIDGAYMSWDGLGADDRAGVYAIMSLIQRNTCDVLFTSFEEKGLLGAKKYIEDYPDNPKYHMLIQLDTSGSDVAKFYKNTAQDFQDYILSFGYRPGYGKGTDVKAIAPFWKVNAVNLSVGYYYAHKRNELLKIAHLEKAIYKVNKMLSQPIPNFKYRCEQ